MPQKSMAVMNKMPARGYRNSTHNSWIRVLEAKSIELMTR